MSVGQTSYCVYNCILTEVNSLISLYCAYTTVTILIIVYSTLYSVSSVTLCCSTQNLYTVLFVLQMSICVCAQMSMRVRESRGVTDKPSPEVRSISKPRSRGIPHYITPSPAGNPRVSRGVGTRAGLYCIYIHINTYIYI